MTKRVPSCLLEVVRSTVYGRQLSLRATGRYELGNPRIPITKTFRHGDIVKVILHRRPTKKAEEVVS